MPIHFTCVICGTPFAVNRVRADRPAPRGCDKRCRALVAWDTTRERTPITVRFWSKVTKGPHHWLWTAGLDSGGYGALATTEGRSVHAHIFAWELLKGPIPPGYEIDHLCRVRHCVNPDHLEPVPPRVNKLRGFSAPALNARRTHCLHGHEFTEANTYRGARGDRRQCKTCRREIDRKRLSGPNRRSAKVPGPSC